MKLMQNNQRVKVLLFVTFVTLSSLVLGKTEARPAVASKSLAASEILAGLKKGNERFVSGKVRTDGQSKSDILRLATGQNPDAVVLSCSDSRVPPEAVFDQKLGEIFTVRSAGEALSPQAIASIEFAIENLGSRLVVVMGHTNCGAIKASIETLNGKSTGSENLDKLTADIHPRIKSKFDEKNPSKNLKEESWLNARGVAKDLIIRSGLISKAVASGKIEIKVGLYDLKTGLVEFE